MEPKPSSIFNFQYIRCIFPGCTCQLFNPSICSCRQCKTCGHGWIAHALDKVGLQPLYGIFIPVEIVQPSIVYDISSLILYGTQTIPMRLKILLDRLYSVLRHGDILNIIHSFGWKYEDYVRGYVLKDMQPLESWISCTKEEETLILHQFIRFGETREIAYKMLIQENKERHDLLSNLQNFLETTNSASQYWLPVSSTQQSFSESNSLVGTEESSPSISEDHTAMIKEEEDSESNADNVSFVTNCNTKRRVLCTVCNKTFCDKGALKIHYSAVHLKEMHRCTIFGCGMWFSSRRSRNRHSSNPNPRLHMSHTSRKLPDGARIVDDGNGNCLTSKISMPSTIVNPPIVPDPIRSTASNEHVAEDILEEMRSQCSKYVDLKNTQATEKSCVSAKDKKNSRCSECYRQFSTHFGLRQHYQDAHMKLIYCCTITGCGAKFPTKRSRDRHSLNVSLHLKLLSTSCKERNSIV